VVKIGLGVKNLNKICEQIFFAGQPAPLGWLGTSKAVYGIWKTLILFDPI
jgi:hypothetical protein